MEYIALLHKAEDSDYGVSFPDFPGCITAGKNLEEARKFAEEALKDHIEILLEDNNNIPEATSLDDILKDPNAKDAIPFALSYNPRPKTVRINITLREDHLARIDRLASSEGKNRSAFLVDSALSLEHQANAFGFSTEETKIHSGLLNNILSKSYTSQNLDNQNFSSAILSEVFSHPPSNHKEHVYWPSLLSRLEGIHPSTGRNIDKVTGISLVYQYNIDEDYEADKKHERNTPSIHIQE